MKARKIIKRIECVHRFEDSHGYSKYYAFTKSDTLMSGYELVTEGRLKEGDYFKDGEINGETRWTKAIGAIHSPIDHRGACRPKK